MVDANIKIIGELKLFLDTVSKESSVRKLFTLREEDFIRNRKLPMAQLIGLIINMPKRSLSIEIQAFFDSLEKEDLSKGPCGQGCTKGAFSLQRTKLNPLFFAVWNRWLVNCFYEHYGTKVKRWRGFRLQAVDGSRAYLVNRKDVVDHFGTQSNQHVGVPMAQVMQVQDILNDITVWGDIYPVRESEQTIMNSRVHHLYEDSLTIFDRGYPSFTLMYLMINEETPRHFVIRCKVGFNNEVKQFVKSRKSSKVIELRATSAAIATLRENGYIVTAATTIKIRLVKIKLPNGEVEILLTNLYDEKLFTLADLKQLYGMRWRIETTYGKQKNQQQMEQFSGHRVICIQQDYGAGLFVANLQSLIEKQCEDYLQKVNATRKYDYKINRNISWAALKYNIVKLFLDNNPKEILLQLQKLFERNIEPIRPGRQNPRVKKAKRLNGKYQTFTNYKRAI